MSDSEAKQMEEGQEQKDKEVEEEVQEEKNYSLEILITVKTAQSQHGLRHEDYMRYRQYCTRRLYRLCKSLNFLHGKGKHFTPKKLNVNMVTDPRFLELPLYNAERAWSFAMQLKEEAPENPRAKFRMRNRLKRAVAYTSELVTLCEATADNRTKLEAEAYHNWMTGNLYLELGEQQEDMWEKARESFKLARTVFGQLGKLASDSRELFKQKVREIDASIRFCNYNLGEDQDAQISELIEDSGNSALLQAQIDKVLSETRKKQAETMSEVVWNGRTITIKNAKLRNHILEAVSYLLEAENSISQSKAEDNRKAQREKHTVCMDLFEHAFLSYTEAINVVRDDIKALKSLEKRTLKIEAQEEELTFLQQYLQCKKVEATMSRDLQVIDFNNDSLENKGSLKSLTTLIKAYDNVIQHVMALSELRYFDEEFVKSSAAQLIYMKAFRCYYKAVSFYMDAKWAEALALFRRTEEYIASSISHYAQCSTPFENEVDQLNALSEKVRGKKCAANAKAFLEEEKQDNPDQVEMMSQSNFNILENLENYDKEERALKTGQVCEFPPSFKPIPSKPILFDIALSGIDFPNLDHKKAQKRGFFSGWFS